MGLNKFDDYYLNEMLQNPSSTGIALTNFEMICEKTKVSKMPRPTAVAKIFGLHELFLPCFLAFVESNKIIKRSITL